MERNTLRDCLAYALALALAIVAGGAAAQTTTADQESNEGAQMARTTDPGAGEEEVSPAPGPRQLTEDEVKRLVERNEGFQVLRIRPVQLEDRTVYVLSVMYPGGNRNNAFLVETIFVDGLTGERLPSLEHQRTGYVVEPVGPPKKVDRTSTEQIRSQVYWR